MLVQWEDGRHSVVTEKAIMEDISGMTAGDVVTVKDSATRNVYTAEIIVKGYVVHTYTLSHIRAYACPHISYSKPFVSKL